MLCGHSYSVSHSCLGITAQALNIHVNVHECSFQTKRTVNFSTNKSVIFRKYLSQLRLSTWLSVVLKGGLQNIIKYFLELILQRPI